MNGRRAKEHHRRERAERRRNALYKLRHAQTDSQEFGFMVGWSSTPEHLPRVRKETHDRLIATMGAARAGGVVWLQWSGPDALGVLRELRKATSNPDMAALLLRIRRKLEEYGGHLVMARAPAFPGNLPDEGKEAP